MIGVLALWCAMITLCLDAHTLILDNYYAERDRHTLEALFVQEWRELRPASQQQVASILTYERLAPQGLSVTVRVCLCDGAPVGCVVWYPFAHHRGFILFLVVDERMRGCGCGRLLVEDVLYSLRSDGGKSVDLCVRAANKSARRFYENLGFYFCYQQHAICYYRHNLGAKNDT